MKKLIYIFLLIPILAFGQVEALIQSSGGSTPPTDTEKPIIGVLSLSGVGQTTVDLSWTAATDNVGVTGYKVWQDGVSTTIGNVLTYQVTGLSAGGQYNFEVSAFDAANNQSNLSNTINVTTNSPPPLGNTPVITNFRVDDTNKNRIYFDSSDDITGLTITGFVINGKTINSVTLNGTSTTDHYFTVSVAFDFWDNNMIRLGEHEDTSNQQTTLYNFTLSYIENNISEPISAINRYVSAGGSGDGTTEGNAASLSYAITNAIAGQTWWIKAGSYPITSNVSYDGIGTPTSPVKFIGYKNTIGDISTMYWNYGDAINSTEMPYINSSSASINGFRVTESNVIVRNIQVSITGAGSVGFHMSSTTNVIFDNCLSYNTPEYGMLGFGNNQNGRYINSKIQGARFNIWQYGQYCLINNVESHSGSTTTYLLQYEGNNSIIRNSLLSRFVDNPVHTGHGINFNIINGTETSYNLAVDCDIMNTDKGIEFRKGNSHHNVGKRLNIYNNGGSGSEDTGGMSFRDGAFWNVFEDSFIETGLTSNSGAIRLTDSNESGVGAGTNNVLRNTIFKNNTNIIILETSEGTSDLTNFKFYNNTIYTFNRLMWQTLPTINSVNCEFKNNIINDGNILFQNGASFTGWTVDYNTFYNNGFAAQGNNINTDNPNFVDLIDFIPQEVSLIAATRLFGVEYDKNGSERKTTTTMGARKSTTE